MIINPALESALFLVLLASLCYLHSASERGYLFLAGFLAPLLTPRMEIAIGIDWFKCLGPLALLLALTRRRRGPTSGETAGMGLLIVFITVVTSAWMIAEYTYLHRYLDAEEMGLGAAQSFYKMPVQLGSFIGQLTAIYIVPLRATSARGALAAFSGYVTSCLASSVVGVALLAVTGNGMIGREFGSSITSDGLELGRIGGLSGEPRHLGSFLVLVVLLYASKTMFRTTPSLQVPRWMVYATLVALLLTYSTSAWLGLAAGCCGIPLLAAMQWKQVRLRVIGSMAALIVVLVAFTSLGSAIFASRVEQRLTGDTSELDRQKDSYIFDAFADAPHNLIFGYGLGGGDLATIHYLPPEERQYRRPPTPSVTIARVLGDLGLVGALALATLASRYAAKLRRGGDHALWAFAICGGLGTFFMSFMSVTAYFLLVGAALSLSQLTPKQAS